MDLSAGSLSVAARYVSHADAASDQASLRSVPVEAPLNLVYGNVPFAVMMVTPDDLEDFVLGFSFTEGVIAGIGDLRDVSIEHEPRGLRAVVTLAPECLSTHLARQRSMSGRTGCGVCGITELADLPNAVKRSDKSPLEIVVPSRTAIAAAVRSLPAHQPLNDQTRAVHAAAWFTLQGECVAVREDVGRHNALDKLIGALLRRGIDPRSGFVLITSRCSFEMVEKVAFFGAGTLVAVSAPTSLALERARELGITVFAIAREDGATQFTGLPPVQSLEIPA